LKRTAMRFRIFTHSTLRRGTTRHSNMFVRTSKGRLTQKKLHDIGMEVSSTKMPAEVFFLNLSKILILGVSQANI
jgi:hypothetical protein